MKGALHLFGQTFWHETAFIVGDFESLTQLRNAIDNAIANKVEKTQTLQNDGEGYDLIIICADNMETVQTAYSDTEITCPQGDDPFDLAKAIRPEIVNPEKEVNDV
jgi:hypothetical protein